MATTGTTNISFGPSGAIEATKNVTGQTLIAGNSYVESWIRLDATGVTTIDEARVEDLKITAGNIVAGTGFTIYADVIRGKAYNDYIINWVWS